MVGAEEPGIGPASDSRCFRERIVSWAFFACLCLGVLLPLGSGASAVTRVGVIDLEGPIDPAASANVKRQFSELGDLDIDLVVLRLNTPGGLVDAMRQIIIDILASPVPVVGFVGPKGAQAASAGTYILYATHIAAMAPTTNLGAATPVQIPGSRSSEQDRSGSGGTPTLEDKILNNAVAYIRGLAELRGRNADWAEQAVRQAASLQWDDALKLGVIDLVAPDLPELLAELDGRTVDMDGETITLDLRDREIVQLLPNLHHRFLDFVTNPTIAYGLLIIGMIGLMIEVAVPGLFVPGVTGLVSLLLALYAFHLLPVSLVGFGIVVLGLVLMVAELTMPGFGLIGASGIIAFVIGSVFLIDTGVPGYGISKTMVGFIAVISSSLLMMFGIWLRRLHTLPVLGGSEELVGRRATVQVWNGSEGRVRLEDTTWAARFKGTLRPGQRVRVVAVEGLTVDVEPEDEEAAS